MWIKICGNTNLEDAELAVKYGADAVGFVFAESPRQVTADTVRNITAELPAAIEKIGVFVDASFDRIVETVCVAGLTGVQLHFENNAGLAQRVRENFDAQNRSGRRLRILQVLHFDANQNNFGHHLKEVEKDSAIDAILVDSRTATKPGGTGIAFDWKAARESFAREAGHLRLVAAGGLGPENVTKAIEILQPWGVDVVTGVEARPGKKDPARVKTFIEAARSAGVQLLAASC